MIREAELIRIDRKATTGRNRPLRVVVETFDGSNHEVVLKPAGWYELTKKSVVNEVLSSLLAGLLNVPICEPFLVNCSQAMLDNIDDQDISDRLQVCEWPAFASKNAGAQWSIWTSGHTIDPNHSHQALAILAFDAFIDNPDRCTKNPNLLTKASDLRAIDHEMSFAFNDMLPFMQPPPPWKQNSLDWLRHGEQANVLHPALKQMLLRDYNRIRNNWENLSDAELNGVLDLLPFQSEEIADKSQAAIHRIKQVRDNIDSCIEELDRVLS